MNILDLVTGVKRVASTKGGEYAGPCPFCGGEDRFRVWPKQGETGRYWCRQCGAHGDAIQFLRDYEGLSFREACETLGIAKPTLVPVRPAKPVKKEPEFTSWQERAHKFIKTCASSLTSDVIKYLHDRCLSDETIRRFQIGYNPKPKKEPGKLWGVEGEVFLPAGVVIPCLHGREIIRIKIRAFPDGKPKYMCIKGSRQELPWIIQEGRDKREVLIVEGEFDGILLAQELGKEVGVVALGGTGKPTEAFMAWARQYKRALLALDHDEAGEEAIWRRWLPELENGFMAPPVFAKDITEMVQKGVDVKTWLEGVRLYINRLLEGPGKRENNRSAQNPTISHTTTDRRQETLSAPEQPAELPLRADTTCLACKHYQPDWQNPVRRQNRFPLTKGKCELTGLEVLETRTCDRFEPLFRFREPQPGADNSYV
ncbi:MAG: toprim domain-containing protein, partial [Deltaproteobacteria bacterium]|nr:toprim domain-containing protein [Deltaproteobacteria bacterium]